MSDILHMGWPFATVMVALIIGCVVVYGITRAAS
jgi:hypothetical protein